MAALLATAFAAGADERPHDRSDDRPAQELGEVVVTGPDARDHLPPPADPTAFATVIDTRDAPTQVETLADALSDAVGVQVRRFGGLGDFANLLLYLGHRQAWRGLDRLLEIRAKTDKLAQPFGGGMLLKE